MAAYLDSLKLEKGSRIALCSKNCSWWIIADLAIWLSGHVTVPVYPTLTGDTVKYILEHSESKLLFIGKLDEHPWNEMKTGVSSDLATVSFPLSPGDDHDGGKHEKWDDIIKKLEPLAEPVKRDAEELATIICKYQVHPILLYHILFQNDDIFGVTLRVSMPIVTEHSEFLILSCALLSPTANTFFFYRHLRFHRASQGCNA
jgi:hypothetical protein